ncbi:MAG: NAD(P)H-quinone oxidoreductase [Pseudomonadota bacterium]
MTTTSTPTPPPTMTAVRIDGKGGPEVLKPVAWPTPSPEAGDVLIEVAAAGVNRPDVVQRKGLYPAPEGHSDTPGLEVAGTVVACSPGADATWRPGDQVMALVNGGGYAQYCVAPVGACLAIPDRLSMVQAAGLPETFFTVWHNLFQRGGLREGETCLIHGGTSGIGVAAIQIAKARGAHVIITAGSDAKCDAALKLGADHAINYRTEDFVARVKAITERRGVDVILDMVGGDYVDRNIVAAAPDGRIVNIAYQKGGEVTVNLQRAMVKRLTLTGSTLRARSDAVKADIAQGLRDHVMPAVAAGDIDIVVDKTFALEDAAAAHAHLEAGEHVGKVILTVGA